MSYVIRQAVESDIPSIVRLRRIMFISMNITDLEALNKADKEVIHYLETAIPLKKFFGWIAELENNQGVIGTGGLVIDQHPPAPFNFSGKVGYIMNLVVLKEYRRQGVARSIMERIISFLLENDIIVSELHATDMGRRLYEELGYKNSNAMKLTLK